MTPADRALLTEQLIAAEGIRLTPYTDTRGKITIGIGRNLTDVGISRDEADLLFAHDLDATLRGLTLRLPPFATWDAGRQRAVVDLAFNLGVSGLLTFTRFLEYLTAGDYAAASADLLTTAWCHQVAPARVATIRRLIDTGA